MTFIETLLLFLNGIIRYLKRRKKYALLVALSGLVFLLFRSVQLDRLRVPMNFLGQDDIRSSEARVYRWRDGKWCRIPAFCSNTENFQSVRLKSPVGSVNMYIHNVSEDDHISMSLWKSGMWESTEVNQMISYLNTDPDIGLIDLGSHLGVYSIVAALMGRHVVAVDPLVQNVLRLCRTIQDADMTDRVTISFTAISDTYGTATFKRKRGNIGNTFIEKLKRPVTLDTNDNYNADIINTVHLDDILPFVNFTKVFMKIDVENQEYEALKEGRELFDSRNVLGILMEWTYAQLSLSSDHIMKLLYSKRFKAIHPFTNKTLERSRFLVSWPHDILWVK